MFSRALFLFTLVMASQAFAAPQTTATGGTIDGSVTDPSGLPVPGAAVEVQNPVSGYKRNLNADENGAFHLSNIPPNKYHVVVSSTGFTPYQVDVQIRSSVPITLKAPLALAQGSTSVTVTGDASDLLEDVPSAHADVDRTLIEKLPSGQPGSGLSNAITLAAPGVVADSNGFFHPLGDHAQTSFVVDNQPISDQQSKQFSTQLPLNAIESFEAVYGFPSAEFGDKTSLVVNTITRSGLGRKLFGSVVPHYGSFGTAGEDATLGGGNARVGNFTALNFTRSGRFLDSPEFRPFHDTGNNFTFFNRTDFTPSAYDTFHLNLFASRNWFQVANTFDQQFAGQDQHQQARTFNIAPGWVHTFNANTVFTLNPFYRQDIVQYYPSRDVTADTPATLQQDRRLGNLGVRASVSYVKGIHNIKIGGNLSHTFLRESFGLGVTDPTFNAVCLNAAGDAVTAPSLRSAAACAPAGFSANPAFQSGLLPFDLTRGGRLFQFRGRTDVKQVSGFAQDAITVGDFTTNIGLRVDSYNGLSDQISVQPRIGLSYHLKPTATVIRASFARTMETPYNENLIVSSGAGLGGLSSNVFGALGSEPLRPGNRNQYNVGFEQSVTRFLALDLDYFWKFTRNAYDFDTLFNTPVFLPISWYKSKIDGLSGRLNLTPVKGFSAFVVLGHTRARFFGPENGGLIFNSPVEKPVFRIDHDQKFQQTTNLRYEFKNKGPWLSFTWRYDSGLVAGAIPGIDAALALDGAQQAAIGVSCGGVSATIASPITSCSPQNFKAARLRIPAPGTQNDDTNPTRVSPRHLFDAGAGIDNLFHTEKYRITAQFSALNLSNEVALYNFQSTFSGTHFVTPRSYRIELGVVF